MFLTTGRLSKWPRVIHWIHPCCCDFKLNMTTSSSVLQGRNSYICVLKCLSGAFFPPKNLVHGSTWLTSPLQRYPHACFGGSSTRFTLTITRRAVGISGVRYTTHTFIQTKVSMCFKSENLNLCLIKVRYVQMHTKSECVDMSLQDLA